MTKTPADWAIENSPFIKLDDGESVTGIYEGYKEGSYKGTALLEYSIDGKTLSSGSKPMARTMGNIAIGSKIKITRHGLMMETKYIVEMVEDNKSEPEQPQYLKELDVKHALESKIVIKPTDVQWED